MNALIDTHVLLFALVHPQRLSRTASRFLQNNENQPFVSVVSFWEISLKASLGKLRLTGISPEEVPHYAASMGLEIEPLKSEVASTFHLLPRLERHRDPFDRMLVWQAIRGQMPLVSRDRIMSAYEACGLSVIW